MNTQGAVRKRLVLAFLFTSGATSLVYQLVWSRYLSNLLGNSGQAHAVVVATFMGGLALGAWLFGRRADRTARPLALYGVLELGVAFYALIFPWVLEILGGVYLTVAPALPEGARVFPKLMLAALSLLVPTLLMGGTLPALARHFTQSLGAVEREVARLYAVNSLGAAFGAFYGGVRAVPDFGLLTSSYAAAALNIVLALGALVLARRAPPAAISDAPEQGSAMGAYPQRAVRAALIGVALTGFTSMLLEVSWIRVLTLTLGASTYAFTLILTSFILGIGLGSFWLATRKKQHTDALRLFAYLQFAQLLALCVAIPLYTRLPYHFWQARAALTPSFATWTVYQGITFLFCCGVLLIPTFFMGAAFPAAARVATSNVKELGRQLGGVYLWNTVGTISGAALGGLWLMPAIGLEGNFLLGIALTALTGLWAFWNSPSRQGQPLRSLWPMAAAVVVMVAFGIVGRGWSTVLSEAGTFRSSGPPPDSFAGFQHYIRHVDGQKVELRFHADDTFATISVGEVPQSGLKFLRLNGKVDASNASDMETMILTGHLGMLLHERDVKRVLIIGAGSGVTAGAVLQHDVEEVDLVEISPAMLDAARFFDQENLGAFEDPRLKVHIEDAKTFMALAGKKYDLIISEPSNPWVAGVAGLFTREFFQAARAHLTDDGLLVQWIHAYESDQQMIRLVVRTMRETFPHATTWLGPIDILFVAGQAPLEANFDVLERRMAHKKVRADLDRIHLGRPYALLAKQIHSDEGQAAFGGQGEINTDDRNVLEFAAPIAFFLRRRVTIDDERYSQGGGQRLLLHRYVAQRPPTVEDARDLYLNLVEGHPPGDPLRRGAARSWRALSPDDGEALLAAATEATWQWDFADADSALAPLLLQAPRKNGVLKVWLELEARRASRLRSAFSPQRAPDALIMAEAFAAAASDRTLAEPKNRFCRVVKAADCGQTPEITEASASSR